MLDVLQAQDNREAVSSLAAGSGWLESRVCEKSLRGKNSRLGFATSNTGLYRGFAVCNSRTALGLRSGWLENRGGAYRCARYYDQNTGRFVSEDPLRFAAGNNFYRYVENDPLDGTDPDGLDTYTCTKPLHALGKHAEWAKDNIQALPLFHQYLCVVQGDKIVCGGQDHAGNGLYSPGKPSDDTMSAGTCGYTSGNNNCFDNCVLARIEDPKRPQYSVQNWPGTNCQSWADDVVKQCVEQCRPKPDPSHFKLPMPSDLYPQLKLR
jgi:RHS repeat-associated protein